MAERDRPAIDVETLRIDGQLAEAGEHLRGEGFIELDQIDLVERQPGDFQHLANRRHRSDAEALRFDTRGCERDESRERLQTTLFRERCGRYENGGGPITCLRRVARSHSSGYVECRPQRCECLRGGI